MGNCLSGSPPYINCVLQLHALLSLFTANKFFFFFLLLLLHPSLDAFGNSSQCPNSAYTICCGFAVQQVEAVQRVQQIHSKSTTNPQHLRQVHSLLYSKIHNKSYKWSLGLNRHVTATHATVGNSLPNHRVSFKSANRRVYWSDGRRASSVT